MSKAKDEDNIKLEAHALGKRRPVVMVDLDDTMSNPRQILGGGEIKAEPQRVPITLNAEDAVTYESINTRNASKIITTIRRFVCTKDTNKSPGYPDNLRTIHFREGDIIEEIFDKPNVFYNISHLEREEMKSIQKYDHRHHMEIHTINWENRRQEVRVRIRANNGYEIVENTMFENFEPMENIDVKDSTIFQMRKRKAVTMLRARIRKAQALNEEINNLNYMLEIETEEE